FQYYPGYDNTGTQPARFVGNTLTNVFNGFDFTNAQTVNYLSGNVITGTGGAGTGIGVGTGSTLTTGGTAGANGVRRFATGVDVNGGTASLMQDVITGNGTGVSVSNSGVLTAVTQNAITTNAGDGISIAPTAGSVAAIFNNDLGNNAGLGVNNQTGTLVNASANWWGTNTPAGVAAEVSAAVDYTPWFDSSTDTGGAAGFQGDFSVLHVDDNSPQSGPAG